MAKIKGLVSFWWDKMIFSNVTFSIRVTGTHKHSLNFDLRDHHFNSVFSVM